MEKITFIEGKNIKTYQQALGIDEMRDIDLQAHIKKADHRLCEMTKRDGHVDSMQVVKEYTSAAQNEAELVFLSLMAGMKVNDKNREERVKKGPFAKLWKELVEEDN